MYVVSDAPPIRTLSLYHAIVSPSSSVTLASKLAEPPTSSLLFPNTGAEHIDSITSTSSSAVQAAGHPGPETTTL